jgi:DNA-binding GntR family transcriptional regulator
VEGDETAEVARLSAAERAYRYTKQRLLDGDLVGGEFVSEGDVAAAVGVSRTPVRDAFLRLEAEGYLRLFPKRGAQIVPVTEQEIRDVLETRLVIEAYAAERIVREGIDVAERLGSLLTAQESAAAAEDSALVVERDRAFHLALVRSAGNDIMTRLYDTLRERQHWIGAQLHARDPHRSILAVADHRRILAALEARDARAARAIIQAHLEAVRAGLQAARMLRDDNPLTGPPTGVVQIS